MGQAVVAIVYQTLVSHSGHGWNNKLLVWYSGHGSNNKLFPGI